MGLKWVGAMLGAGLVLVGCTTPPAKREIRIEVGESIEGNRADADVQRVVEGVQMVLQGHIQAAIDGPFDEVAQRYEAQYGHMAGVVYSARGTGDALLYAAMADENGKHVPVTVLGPAWAMAYWGRGYAYNEMARYDDAIVELQRALALAPLDAQYNIEIGFAYQRKSDWKRSLEHYKSAEAYAPMTAAAGEVTEITCKALRGQGYDLVEMHRYGEARAAYRGCLKLKPDEPKSLGELKYIDQVEGKQTST